MKIRLYLLLLTMLFAGDRLAAQVEFIAVEKLTDYKQTDTGTVVIKPLVQNNPTTLPPLSAPYQFRIDVEGTNISGLTTPTFTVPASSSFDDNPSVNYNLSYDSDAGEWRRNLYFGSKYSATGGPPSGTGAGGLDGLFANGDYTVTIGATTVNLTLGGASNADVYPNTPIATLSAGTWAGGGTPTLQLNVNQALTITTNTFTNFQTNGYLNHIGLFINGNGSDLAEVESFSDNTNFPDDANTDFLSYTINAGTLVSGQTYYVEIEFNTVTDQSSEYADALGVALFTSRTQFQIQAVPEPATFAAIIGLVALALVPLARRRFAVAPVPPAE